MTIPTPSTNFLLSLLLGQFLALCITTTNLTTSALVDFHHIRIPTTQTFTNYCLLTLVYNYFIIKKVGLKGFIDIIKDRGWFYLALAIVDVEANYFIVKGFGYTSYLSAMLINACSTPGIVLLSYLFLNTRYKLSHIFGISIAMLGLVILVASDVIDESSFQGKDALLGDAFCMLGATLYAVSNTLEEYYVRRHDNHEVIGMLGLFGVLINGIQVWLLESDELKKISWSSNSIGLYIAFTIATFSLYSLVPVLIELSSATFYNLSLLTADFYGLILGFFFLPIKLHPMYPFAFTLIMVGLTMYCIKPTDHYNSSSSTELTEALLPFKSRPTSFSALEFNSRSLSV